MILPNNNNLDGDVHFLTMKFKNCHHITPRFMENVTSDLLVFQMELSQRISMRSRQSFLQAIFFRSNDFTEWIPYSC